MSAFIWASLAVFSSCMVRCDADFGCGDGSGSGGVTKGSGASSVGCSLCAREDSDDSDMTEAESSLDSVPVAGVIVSVLERETKRP